MRLMILTGSPTVPCWTFMDQWDKMPWRRQRLLFGYQHTMNDRTTTNSYTRPGRMHDMVSVNKPWIVATRQTATQTRDGCMIGFQSTHHEWSRHDKQLHNTGTDAWYGFSQHTMNDRNTTNSTQHRDGCMIWFQSTHHEWSRHDKQLHKTGTDAW